MRSKPCCKTLMPVLSTLIVFLSIDGSGMIAAQESPTLTSSITAKKTSVKESATFVISMVVANHGTATVTGVQPSSLDVSGTGWATLSKWPTPASASIDPGKAVTFSLSYKAMLAGTVVLNGNATSDAGDSAANSSPTITITPKKAGAAAVTDDSGNATLKSGKVTLPIQIMDEDTGSPISGLSLALALDKKNRSRAVLAMADPLGRYPLQVIVLQGPDTSVTSTGVIRSAALQTPTAAPVTVSSQPNCSSENLYVHVILPVETTALPPLPSPPPPPAPLSDTTLEAIRAAASSMLQQTLKATVSSGTISCADALTEDIHTLMELPVDRTVGMFIVDPAAEAACALAVPEFAPACPAIVENVGRAGDLLTLVNLANDVFQCGLNPSDELALKRVTLLPGSADLVLWQELVAPEQTAPQLVQVPVSAVDSHGQPLSSGSLELVSQSNLGSGFRGVIDSGTAQVPVPLGDYGWTLRSQGFEPQCGQVSVTESGAVINAALQPQPIASATVGADQLTGFLPQGTQFAVTPHFFDADDNEVTCDGPVKFYAHNPVGTLVATVDPDTGLVTMQDGCGAAGITAWCNGVESERLLVSTDCNGTLPPKPPPPKTGGGGCPQTWVIFCGGQTATLAVDCSGQLTGSGWVISAPGCGTVPLDITSGNMSGASMTFSASGSGCCVTETGTGSGTLNVAFPNALTASGTIPIHIVIPCFSEDTIDTESWIAVRTE